MRSQEIIFTCDVLEAYTSQNSYQPPDFPIILFHNLTGYKPKKFASIDLGI